MTLLFFLMLFLTHSFNFECFFAPWQIRCIRLTLVLSNLGIWNHPVLAGSQVVSFILNCHVAGKTGNHNKPGCVYIFQMFELRLQYSQPALCPGNFCEAVRSRGPEAAHIVEVFPEMVLGGRQVTPAPVCTPSHRASRCLDKQNPLHWGRHVLLRHLKSRKLPLQHRQALGIFC